MPLNLFLRESEKRNVAEWSSSVDDRSLTTRLMDPLWDRLELLVPKYVAPNVISLASLMCVLHAYYISTSLQVCAIVRSVGSWCTWDAACLVDRPTHAAFRCEGGMGKSGQAIDQDIAAFLASGASMLDTTKQGCIRNHGVLIHDKPRARRGYIRT